MNVELANTFVPGIQNATFPEIVLSRSFGGDFRSRECVARVNDGVIEIRSTGELQNFPEMAKRRGRPENKLLEAEQVLTSLNTEVGRTLSNVGVSAAIQIEIQGQNYLLCQYRRRDEIIGLISGYVNAQEFLKKPSPISLSAEFLSTGVAEVHEEMLPVQQDSNAKGKISLGTLIAKNSSRILDEIVVGKDGGILSDNHSGEIEVALGQPYTTADDGGLADFPFEYADQYGWSIRPVPVPGCVPSVKPDARLVIDGKELEAGFLFDKPNDSGQIIFSYKIAFNNLATISLLHAETAPDSASGPGMLKEVLDRDGIVLMRIGEDGLLDGSSSWLREGQLVPRPVAPEDIKLSEAFVRGLNIMGEETGIVPATRISFSDYRQQMLS